MNTPKKSRLSDYATVPGPARSIALLGAVSAMAIGGFSPTVMAQDSAADEPRERIIVTARLREETAQTVPISITAISEQTLEDATVVDIQDLILLTPGLTSSSPFGRINASPSLRGLVNAGLGEEQTVAFFVDGVYISGRTGLNATYFGLERVEVSKGPQSALYGRNAFIGAVNYITKRPTEEFEGDLRLEAGANELLRGTVELAGPLNDDGSLLGRVGLFASTYGGDFENSVPGGPDIGSNDTTALLGSLLWEPNASSELYFKALYSDEADGAPPHFLVPANSQPAPGSGFPRYFTGTLPTEGAGFFTNPEHQGVERETLRLSLNGDFDLDENLLLQSITGYNTQEGFYDFDADYTALFFNRTFEEFDKWDFSQDLRLSNANSSSPVQWLVGGSYYYFADELNARNYLPGFGQSLPDGTLSELTTESLGIYGSVTFDLSESFEFTGELRYNDETKTLERPGFDLEADWQEFLPRATLSYMASDLTMFYGSVARGFKTGGFNTFDNLFPEERIYDPESNWTYEVGVKTEGADGKWLLNAAGYYIDVSDQQVIGLSTAATSSNQFTDNAAESSVLGLELEGTWSTDLGIDFSGGYAWTDATFDDFNDPDLAGLPVGTDVSGNRINRTSEHQFNLSGEYAAPLNMADRDLEWFGRADYAWQSSQFSVPANLAETGAITQLNARIGVRGDGWALSAFGKNLTDDDTPYVGVRWFDASGTYTQLPPFQRAWLVTAREGTTWGITLDVDFGN
jgi:iron complex outermembrane receptor protein